jgi:hypothetical protein
MLRVDLVVAISLDDFCGTLSGLLRALGKAIKSHHTNNPSFGI